MRYIKQNFYAGQKLKASHLEHMEDGILACDVGLRVGDEAGAFAQDSFLAQIGGQDIQITGALATGIGSIAFGGQRYDKAGADFSEGAGKRTWNCAEGANNLWPYC